MELGGLWWTSALNSALPPQRHRTDMWLEYLDSFSHTARRKGRKKERKEGRKEGRKRERKKGRKKKERKKREKVTKIKN